MSSRGRKLLKGAAESKEGTGDRELANSESVEGREAVADESSVVSEMRQRMRFGGDARAWLDQVVGRKLGRCESIDLRFIWLCIRPRKSVSKWQFSQRSLDVLVR